LAVGFNDDVSAILRLGPKRGRRGKGGDGGPFVRAAWGEEPVARGRKDDITGDD
jgi:hypothetical protein